MPAGWLRVYAPGTCHRGVRQPREPAPFPATFRALPEAGVTRITAKQAPRSDHRCRGVGAMSPTQVMVAILTFLVIVTTAITFS